MKNFQKLSLVIGLIALGTSASVHATATNDAIFRSCYNSCQNEKVSCTRSILNNIEETASDEAVEALLDGCKRKLATCLGGCMF